MSIRAALVTALFIASAGAALAAPVRRAGEWSSTIDNGAPHISCLPNDEAFDQKTLMRPLEHLPGASCHLNSLNTLGPITSVSIACTIGGSVMTTSGTVVTTGIDAFTSKMHSHGGAIPMGDGKIMAMPDTNMTVVSHRLGACKPGDHVSPY